MDRARRSRDETVTHLVCWIFPRSCCGGVCDDSTDGRVTTSPVGSDADALAGTSWVAQRISNDSGGREALAGNEPTIDFGADGSTVSGSTGCNLYSGDVTIGRARSRWRRFR